MATLDSRALITEYSDVDLIHIVDKGDTTAGINGTSKRSTLFGFRGYVLDPALVKAAYEINPDTNALTDDNALKLSYITITEPVNLNMIDGGII